MNKRGSDEAALDAESNSASPGAAQDRMGLVIVGFDDMVRAEQAARAADFWRRANRTLPIGPITVVGRTLSGSVAVTSRGVVRPQVGARIGFLIGLFLLGLPAAGVAGFVGWLLGALVTGLLSLTGLIDGAVATFVTVAAALGSAVIGGLLVGLLGGLTGAAIGAIVGVIHSRMRGFTGSQVGAMAADVVAGTAVVAVKAGVSTVTLVTGELLRLGGIPRLTPAVSSPAGAVGEGSPGEANPTGGTDAAAR